MLLDFVYFIQMLVYFISILHYSSDCVEILTGVTWAVFTGTSKQFFILYL